MAKENAVSSKKMADALEMNRVHDAKKAKEMADAMGEAMAMDKERDAKIAKEKEEESNKPGKISKFFERRRKRKENKIPKYKPDKPYKPFKSLADRLAVSDTAGVLIFFFLAVGIHVFDAFHYFSRNLGDGVVMFVLYLFLTLIGIFLIFKTNLTIESRKIIILSLIAFIWPLVYVVYNPSWMGALLLITPIWVWYILLTEQDSKVINVLRFLCIAGLIGAGIFALLTSSLVEGGFSVQGRVDVSTGVDWLKVIFIDNAKEATKSILAFPAKIRSKVNQTYSMSYFTGQVEQNEQEPLGVYLEDLRAMESFFYENNSVIIWATLRGKSFEGIIKVKNYCYINLGGGKRINGEVIPFDPELFYDESRPLECVFKDGLKKGHYTVTFTSTFEFPTWGYVEYTFVDRATRMAYYSQGEDINRELSIPKKSVMIYTNGPVSIGSNIRDMPLVIYPDSNSLQRFGVTIANIWPQGEILTLTKMEIRVPEGIELNNCIPKPGQTSDGENGYTIYTFKLESPKEFFTTETCEMNIIDKKNFLKDNLKVTKTFAIKAEYIYSLEKTINIRVENI